MQLKDSGALTTQWWNLIRVQSIPGICFRLRLPRVYPPQFVFIPSRLVLQVYLVEVELKERNPGKQKEKEKNQKATEI